MQRIFISLCVIALTLAACANTTPKVVLQTTPTSLPTTSGTLTLVSCPITPYVNDHPPDANTAKLTDTWYANEWLWAGLPPPYRGVWYAGGVKVGWWRSVSGRLAIEGRRLDTPAPPLRANIPEGYGLSGFQATGLDFPTEGCWEVVGRVADKFLRFVVQVHPASENPTKSIATPSSTLTPVAIGLLDCTRNQLRQLVDDFFVAYNQHDLARLLSLFDFTSGFQYYDDVGGQRSDIHERADLERYLQSRFALSDQFTVLEVQLPAQNAVPFCTTNPTAAFTRSDANRQYTGNAKLVVSGGKLHAIVTSSTVLSPTAIATAAGLADLKAPTPQPGYFWSYDEPKDLPPLAFGVLPRDNQPGQGVAVGGYELVTSFPSFLRELDVYLVGDYPANHCTVLLSIVKSLQGWDCIPFYSLVQYRGETPLGEKMATVTSEQIARQAVQLIKERGLLMPDQSTPTARQNDDGTWRVWFFQRVSGIPIYTNKGLAVTFNRDGQATNIIGRRRPLLARSRYPLRTPEEAWERFKEGKARSFYVDDLSRPHPGTVDRFTQIELAYAEVEVITAQQIMQPYYVFHAETGQTLYVPAVAEPYAQLP